MWRGAREGRDLVSEQRAAARARAASEAHRRAAEREERRRAESKTFRALTSRSIAGRASGWKTAKTAKLWKASLERWERPLPRREQVRVERHYGEEVAVFSGEGDGAQVEICGTEDAALALAKRRISRGEPEPPSTGSR